MPVMKRFRISRTDLRHNPGKLYLFGDNEQRKGFGGQARAMRGEPNAIGIRTKRAPTMNAEDFWSDHSREDTMRQCAMIDQDLSIAFDFVADGGTVVIPADGIGTGLARLAETAPQTFAHLQTQLALLAQR